MSGMRRVGIPGVGLVPFDKFRELPAESIARPAVIAALKDAGISPGGTGLEARATCVTIPVRG